jgi:hypothetical protein
MGLTSQLHLSEYGMGTNVFIRVIAQGRATKKEIRWAGLISEDNDQVVTQTMS